MSPACAGRFQSPIDIRPELTSFCQALQPLELLGYELPPLPELSLRNNGHTGEVSGAGPREGSGNSAVLGGFCYRSRVGRHRSLATLHAVQLTLPPGLKMALGPGQEYRALQLHLHWGTSDYPGSEHTVNGHRFPAEVGIGPSREEQRGCDWSAGLILTLKPSLDPYGSPQYCFLRVSRSLGSPWRPGRFGCLSAGTTFDTPIPWVRCILLAGPPFQHSQACQLAVCSIHTFVHSAAAGNQEAGFKKAFFKKPTGQRLT